jgi:YesN/AraC family two-component response regulator
MKTSLSRYYQVDVAKNGVEAWKSIPLFNPDVIVSDLQMPEMNGFELCTKVKDTFETSHIPVILLTVVDNEPSMEKGFGLGADDYIAKPVDIKYLRMKIDSIIQNRKTLRRKFLGIDNVQSDERLENEHNAKFLKQVTEIVNKNISNSRFSIADFSKEIGLSRSLLYTKFSSITGYTPNDFIKIARMNKAIRYFGEKKYSISEVAFMVGFEDHAYFSTCFKKIYGVSPKQFVETNMTEDRV